MNIHNKRVQWRAQDLFSAQARCSGHAQGERFYAGVLERQKTKLVLPPKFAHFMCVIVLCVSIPRLALGVV